MPVEVADFLRTLSYALIPGIFAITVHEVAHGWVAKQLGDPTAYMLGRLTLNPVKHIDLMGTVVVPLAMLWFTPWMFGWAKPVPVAFRNLRKPKRDMVLVAAAGPGANFAMATLWAILGAITIKVAGFPSTGWLANVCHFGIYINCVLAVFNLLPIPPLDGGRVLAGLLPREGANLLERLEPFGFMIVILLVVAGVLGQIIDGPFRFFFDFFSRNVAGFA